MAEPAVDDCELVNFSFIDDNVAGMAIPSKPEDVDFLVTKGFSQVFSLTKDPPNLHNNVTLQQHHYPVEDFTPPTQTQIDSIVKLLIRAKENDKKAVVHCKAGRGRTGTILACYIAATEGLSGDEAIQKIRRMRPGSIETMPQEDCIRDFASKLKK